LENSGRDRRGCCERRALCKAGRCRLEIDDDLSLQIDQAVGYDSAANRADCRRRDIVPVILAFARMRRTGDRFFPILLYKTRARVEQMIGKLERFKRIAMRCDKTQHRWSPLKNL
jgi:hypothetical protein